MTTASKITIIRIIMVPVFMIVLLSGIDHANTVALIIYILAAITDAIDGYIARNYNQITSFGKFIDPLADKLLVTSAILIFVEWGQMPAWAAMIILTREFAVTGLRLVAVDEGVVIAAGRSGKIKTVVSMVGICFMLLPLHSYDIIGDFLNVDGLIVLLMVVTTVWSGVEYFVKNRKVFMGNG